jgi:hypothetical protein
MCDRRIHKLFQSILGWTLLSFIFSSYGLAGDVKLAWDANNESILSGYKIYWGAASKSYSNSLDVGNVTSYTVSGLSSGTYYFAVTAYSIYGDETGYSNEASTTVTASDTSAPSIAITSPTSGPTYNTGSSSISIGGSASDNVAVTQVSWVNSRGGSGIASGTPSWSVSGITLQSGSNVLTVTARDAAGNSGTATLTVTYTPPDTTAPTIAITSPTSGATYSTNSSSISIGGSASDNVAVTQVTWTNDRGGTGTASGTSSWSVSGIALQSGSNVLTVTARDAAGNIGIATIVISYDERPEPPGGLRITSP